MVRVKAPRVPEEPSDVLREDDLKALLRTCEGGRSYEDRRDAAIIRTFIDTGLRLSEAANLRWNPDDADNNDVDLDQGVLRVLGKGQRWRLVPIGARTVRAIGRHIRRRSQHAHAATHWLWLGQKGRMTDSGIRQMIRRRGKQAGLGHIHPHQLRHSFAHHWLHEGGTEGDLMRIHRVAM